MPPTTSTPAPAASLHRVASARLGDCTSTGIEYLPRRIRNAPAPASPPTPPHTPAGDSRARRHRGAPYFWRSVSANSAHLNPRKFAQRKPLGGLPYRVGNGDVGVLVGLGESCRRHGTAMRAVQPTAPKVVLQAPKVGAVDDKPWGRFICPRCGQSLDMHVSHGPGTPGTERFNEVA
jgi:hypothetical protein